MRTKYCPHCGSQRIHKEECLDGSHYHECDDCQEDWQHCDSVKAYSQVSDVSTETDEFDAKIACRGNN